MDMSRVLDQPITIYQPVNATMSCIRYANLTHSSLHGFIELDVPESHIIVLQLDHPRENPKTK